MWNPFKSKVSGPSVTFLPLGKSVTVAPGTSVLDAAIMHKIPLHHSCDGNLACTTCHVYVESGFDTGKPSVDEENLLEFASDVQDNSRLGCQLRVYHDMTVRIPKS